MSDKTGGPAFPVAEFHLNGNVHSDWRGMTLRQYAAIKLRVPNSGTDWLDEMIMQSLRDEMMTKLELIDAVKTTGEA